MLVVNGCYAESLFNIFILINWIRYSLALLAEHGVDGLEAPSILLDHRVELADIQSRLPSFAVLDLADHDQEDVLAELDLLDVVLVVHQ